MGAQFKSRDATAKAFVEKKAYQGGAAMFSNGRDVYSYGDHFMMAEWRDDGSIGVNEASYSRTTAQHKGSVKRALQSAGFAPTEELYRGYGGYHYRVWR